MLVAPVLPKPCHANPLQKANMEARKEYICVLGAFVKKGKVCGRE